MHSHRFLLLLLIAVVLTLHPAAATMNPATINPAAINPALKSIKLESSSGAHPKPPRVMAAARACKGKAENCGDGAVDKHGRRRKSNGEWV
ncbi:uncharacterized protein LAJ45_08460 [Morchella importuna]|uniref:uncharacterized protein n=1 Tax=Morchella importuna TaxID=1174673 RepID=UPI001E8D81BA|nr:uncharacterized protein LAJ45_08460 [Morchella importuna]KAH8147632.1 hypothetical protein LAJ45_08460 [Morchella importuna]